MHNLYKTGDADAPSAIKDRNGEVVLDLCKRCGQGEGELGPTCSGITNEQISALWRKACGPGSHLLADADTMHLCSVALNYSDDFTRAEQHAARARCAEILNARAKEGR